MNLAFQQTWGLAVHTACYLYNRTPHSAINFVTPYEKLYGKIPDLSNIRVFGTRVYVLDELVPKGHKFAPRSNICYLVGFTNTGYVVFEPSTKKTFNTCNVKFDEEKLYKNDFPCKLVESFQVLGPNPESEMQPHVENDSDDEYELVSVEVEDEIDSSKVEKIQVNYCFTDPSLLVSSVEQPLTFAEAMSPANVQKWGPPIQSELNAMSKHQVWDLVPREKGMKLIPVKWIFVIKEDGRPKARLVAVGSRDTEVYSSNEKASPTPAPATIRWFFSTVVKFSWKIVHLDVKNAFLHAPIDRVKYISIPQGVEGDSKRYVCKLNKALYGLATAPKCWNETFHLFMTSSGFVRSEREHCIYTLKSAEKLLLVIVYVDDILVTGSDATEITLLCQTIQTRFDIKVLGPPSNFIGFQVKWGPGEKSVFLHQTKYVESLLTMFNMSSCAPAPTPMVPFSSQTQGSVTWERSFSYKQTIGALLYLANLTRPDVAFAINYLARSQADPQDLHWALLNRVFRYLKGTVNLGLLYKNNSDNIESFVDADFGGDSTRKSTTGFVTRFFGNPVSWCSRLQPCRAESSGEAEYIAICEVARDILFYARLFEETIGSVQYPLPLYEDNMAAISQCTTTSTSKSRIKHIELKYLKTREYFRNNILSVHKIDTTDQLADCLTKPLTETLFVKFRELLLKSSAEVAP